MREYESIYVLKPDLPADGVKALQEKLAAIIEKQGGRVLVQTDWGKRKLAYHVDKFRFGQYIYLQYLDLGAAVAELERILKYDDKVLKFLTVRLADKVDVEKRLASPVVPPVAPEEVGSYESEDYGGRERGGDFRRPDRAGTGAIPPFEDVGEIVE